MKKTKFALKKQSFTEKDTSPLKNDIPSKEMCCNEETNRDEANESKNPVKEESSHQTSISNEANKSQNPVKEEIQSSHKTSTSDELNKSQSPIKEESSYETSTCDEANKSQNPVKEESSHETSTCDEANKSENPVKRETSTCDGANKIDSLFKLKDNILIGMQEHFSHFGHIGFAILGTLKKNPEFIGQVDVTTGEQITFQQMRENSVKCALMLEQIFAFRKCARIVTICTCNPMLEYIPYLAALYLGATVNPWEEEYFSAGVRVHYFLVRHRPGVIFVDEHNATKLKKIVKFLQHHGNRINPQIIVFGGEKKGFISLQEMFALITDKELIDEFSCNRLNLKDPAILMFSPNATHYPGDVMIPYLAFICPNMHQVPKMNYGEIGLWYGSLCWTHSLFLTARAINSFTTVLKCPKWKFCEQHLYQTIQKYKVTWIFLESSMCSKMCLTNFMVGIYDISSLKTFLFGDTPIEEGIHEDFVEYMTDVSVMQVYCDALTGVIAYHRKSSNRRSSGHINNHVKVAVIDINTRQILGPYERGEIWCQSMYVAYSRIFYTYENFVSRERKDWHRTGDYGFFNENGEIYFIDKLRHLIKYKDTIVSAAEIEKVLLCHSDVVEVAVMPIQVANDGQHPVAFVRKISGAKTTEMELVNYVARHMDDNCKLRGGVYFVNDFKRLPNGKIDRQMTSILQQ